jgi:MbtH protein
MHPTDDEDQGTYKVLVNHEEQYSLWPDGLETPAGWREVGKTGSREECMKYVDAVWTDMRPLSLRKQMEAQDSSAQPGTASTHEG